MTLLPEYMVSISVRAIHLSVAVVRFQYANSTALTPHFLTDLHVMADSNSQMSCNKPKPMWCQRYWTVLNCFANYFGASFVHELIIRKIHKPEHRDLHLMTSRRYSSRRTFCLLSPVLLSISRVRPRLIETLMSTATLCISIVYTCYKCVEFRVMYNVRQYTLIIPDSVCEFRDGEQLVRVSRAWAWSGYVHVVSVRGSDWSMIDQVG